MEETVPKVRNAADVTIKGLMVSLDRQEKGADTDKSALAQITELYGFPAHAICSMSDVVEALYNTPVDGKVIIDEALKASIDDYYAQYGAAQ